MILTLLALSAPDAQVLSTAEEILARPEFAARQSSPVGQVLLDLLEQLLDLLAWFDDLQTASPGLFWMLFAGLVVVLLVLVAHIVWTVSTALRRPPDEPSSTPRNTGPRNYLEEARQLAGREQYLEAIQCLVVGLLERTARTGVIDLRPEFTNRAIRMRFERSALPEQLRRELVRLLERTERARFREGAADGGLYRDWRALFDQLDAVVPRA